MDRRHEHVRLLAILHFIYAGLILLGSLMPIFWLLIASVWWPELAGEAGREPGLAPALATGALGMAFVGFWVLLAWIWAGVLVFAGRSLLTMRRHTYCMVVAAVACLNLPLGTVLGVVSLIVLNRQDVRALFDGDPQTTI
jgi:hypothetical protein